MGYCLKSGLSKTVIYETIKAFNSSGVDIPLLRACDFRRYRNSYWLSFSGGDYYYDIFLCVCAGAARIRFVQESFDFDACDSVDTVLSVDVVPFDYLVDHEMLREAA